MLTNEECNAIALALFKVKPNDPFADARYYLQWLNDIRAVGEALKSQNSEFDYRCFIDACREGNETTC